MRKKAGTDDEVQVPALIESDVSSQAFRRSWARLIQKVYQVDPLICPQCKGEMRIISFIEDESVVEKILRHLKLWETCLRATHRQARNQDPLVSESPRSRELTYDDNYSQLPPIDYYLQ